MKKESKSSKNLMTEKSERDGVIDFVGIMRDVLRDLMLVNTSSVLLVSMIFFIALKYPGSLLKVIIIVLIVASVILIIISWAFNSVRGNLQKLAVNKMKLVILIVYCVGVFEFVLIFSLLQAGRAISQSILPT